MTPQEARYWEIYQKWGKIPFIWVPTLALLLFQVGVNVGLALYQHIPLYHLAHSPIIYLICFMILVGCSASLAAAWNRSDTKPL